MLLPSVSIIFKVVGSIGLFFITAGIFAKNEKKQDQIFAIGGICLLLYSIYLKDPVFILLQTIFIAASVYELFTLQKKHRTKKP